MHARIAMSHRGLGRMARILRRRGKGGAGGRRGRLRGVAKV